MQHLDEGTIHAWLDGALNADEAARAEAHVKDCAQCQAAVAEARGFIAASSRILTALDNAPRGVIPAAAPKRRVQPWVWRVAATVLVVAGGTLLLARPSGKARIANSAADSVAQAGLDKATAVRATNQTATPLSTSGRAEGSQSSPAARNVPADIPAQPPRAFSPAQQQAPVRTGAVSDLKLRGAVSGTRLDEQREMAAAKTRVEQSAPTATPTAAGAATASPRMNARTFGAITGVTATTPREVETKRVAGGIQTLYEVSPGDTVTLEEQSAGTVQNIGTDAVSALSRRAQPMARSGKAAAVAEPQQKAEAPPAPPVAVMQDAQVAETHRISWLDRSSGRVLILSGRHSQEELERIRAQIQRLRDAAAQTNRLPD